MSRGGPELIGVHRHHGRNPNKSREDARGHDRAPQLDSFGEEVEQKEAVSLVAAARLEVAGARRRRRWQSSCHGPRERVSKVEG
jgi:hypothetical protein